jgi:hypothetical protein
MKKQVLGAALAAAAVFSGNVYAQTKPATQPVQFFLGAGLTYGGDELASAQFSDGSSTDLRAGNLMHFKAGVRMGLGEAVSASASIGYHVDRASASNGSITFDRFPIELLAHYAVNPQWRIGGGVRFVPSAKLNSSGVAAGINGDFDATTGLVLEAEYLFNPNASVSFRAVSEEYKLSNSNFKRDGSHGAIYVNYYFQ